MKRWPRAPLIALALSLLANTFADIDYSPLDAVASVGGIALLIDTALLVRQFTLKGKK